VSFTRNRANEYLVNLHPKDKHPYELAQINRNAPFIYGLNHSVAYAEFPPVLLQSITSAMVGVKRRRTALRNTNSVAEDDAVNTSDYKIQSDVDDGGRRVVRLLI